jgi:hypothetical protein
MSPPPRSPTLGGGGGGGGGGKLLTPEGAKEHVCAAIGGAFFNHGRFGRIMANRSLTGQNVHLLG